MTDQWLDACAADDIDDEDLITLELGDKFVAVYNTPEGFLPPTACARMRPNRLAMVW